MVFSDMKLTGVPEGDINQMLYCPPALRRPRLSAVNRVAPQPALTRAFAAGLTLRPRIDPGATPLNTDDPLGSS